MSQTKCLDYLSIATAVCEGINDFTTTSVIINMDNAQACIFEVDSKGKCNITEVIDSAPAEDFFHVVADSCFNDTGLSDKVLITCKNMKKALERFIRNGKNENGAYFPVGDDGKEISCKQLTEIYDKFYSSNLKETAKAAVSRVPDNSSIILIGRLSVFYPAVYTVKETLVPMPLLPVKNLIVDEKLSVDVKTLSDRGSDILREREERKKHLTHNVMLQFKKFTPNGLEDTLFMIGKMGDVLSESENLLYSGIVLVHAEDPLLLLVDSTPLFINLPRSIFTRGSVITQARFALGVDGETPKLFVKTDNDVIKIDVDLSIYSEV